jgi:Zn-dependent protease with chaperone function
MTVRYYVELSTANDPHHVIDLPFDAITLLGGYVAITVLAPRLLGSGRALVRYPHLTIGLWLASLALSIGLLWAGTGLIISDWVRRIQFGESLDNWASSVAGSILTWLSIAALGVIAFRLVEASQSVAADRAAQIAAVAPLLTNATQTEIDGHRVYIIESPHAVIAAVPFANAVAVSRNLIDSVPANLVNAALEHERAHLIFRHSVLVSIAQLAVSAAGGIKASRRFTQTIRIAIELVADDWAARRFGRTTVADALEAVYPNSDEITERVSRLRAKP